MIVHDAKKLAFLHIPKAAGTSIRSLFPGNETYWGIATMPDGREIDLAHMTLDEVRTYFPLVFDKLAEYRTFALVRDPYERFISGLFEHIRNFHGKEKKAVGLTDLLRHARSVMAALPSDDVSLSHFKRQIDFVHTANATVASDIYPVAMIDVMLQDMSEYTGETFVVERRNANDRTSVLDRTKVGLGFFFVGGVFMGPLAPRIRRFVLEYYKDDFELLARLERGPIRQSRDGQQSSVGYA